MGGAKWLPRNTQVFLLASIVYSCTGPPNDQGEINWPVTAQDKAERGTDCDAGQTPGELQGQEAGLVGARLGRLVNGELQRRNCRVESPVKE